LPLEDLKKAVGVDEEGIDEDVGRGLVRE